MAEIVPYTVQYPVRFYSGGDTVSEAVYKHIQEFESLYGKLTDLNTRKANSTDVDGQLNDLKTEIEGDLADHINSTDPHPNLTFAKIGGTVSDSQIGSVSSSKISGTFSTDKISKLKDFVQSSVIPLGTLNKKRGYMKFSNGFTLQWNETDPNETDIPETTILTEEFITPFTTLFGVYIQIYYAGETWDNSNRDAAVRIFKSGATGFNYIWDDINGNSNTKNMYISYLAVGVINT